MFLAGRNAAGVKKSAHGVRKIGAARAAEARATVAELEALFGWTGGTMADHDTGTAGRKRRAKPASEKIGHIQRRTGKGKRPHLEKAR